MAKFLKLIVVVFAVPLMMSCGGGGSSSGVDQATDELDQLAASYARPGEDGSEVSSSSSSSSSSSTSSSTTTSNSSKCTWRVGHQLHAWPEKGQAGTCTNELEGYINKYPDILAAYNANPTSNTKSFWGFTHYCTFGLEAGRTYPGLSSATCSSTTTSSNSSTSSTSSDAYEGYVNKYSDLLRVYTARGGSQTKSAWGKTHYCNSGRNEGRTYPNITSINCPSSSTSSSSSSSSSTSSTSSSSSSSTNASSGCTSFAVNGLYHGYSWNPGNKVAAADSTSGVNGPQAWLHVSCPYALYFYDRAQTHGWPWEHYYSTENGGSYRLSSSGRTCIGDTLTYSSNRYVDNQCTITNVTKY